MKKITKKWCENNSIFNSESEVASSIKNGMTLLDFLRSDQRAITFPRKMKAFFLLSSEKQLLNWMGCLAGCYFDFMSEIMKMMEPAAYRIIKNKDGSLFFYLPKSEAIFFSILNIARQIHRCPSRNDFLHIIFSFSEEFMGYQVEVKISEYMNEKGEYIDEENRRLEVFNIVEESRKQSRAIQLQAAISSLEM